MLYLRSFILPDPTIETVEVDAGVFTDFGRSLASDQALLNYVALEWFGTFRTLVRNGTPFCLPFLCKVGVSERWAIPEAKLPYRVVSLRDDDLHIMPQVAENVDETLYGETSTVPICDAREFGLLQS